MNHMESLFDAVKTIVAERGIEPREGFVANELSVCLCNGQQISQLQAEPRKWKNVAEVSVEGRARNGQAAIVRWEGRIVLHECDAQGFATYTAGDWEEQISLALLEIAGEKAAEVVFLRECRRAVAGGGLVLAKVA